MAIEMDRGKEVALPLSHTHLIRSEFLFRASFRFTSSPCIANLMRRTIADYNFTSFASLWQFNFFINPFSV